MNGSIPRSTPMEKAAQSPIGRNPVSTATQVRDVLIVVIAPFVVPGVILGLTRGANFALGDIAFGFVAVAIAGTARAATLKNDEWQAFAILALISVCLQTALAISVDNVNDVERLIEATKGLPQGGNAPTDLLSTVREVAGDVTATDPSFIQWLSSLLMGIVTMAIPWVLIWRER